MNMEHMNSQERYDVLAEMADLYYKQGKTQAEIARIFDTNRFRVAKLLQDALNEHIVEIQINYSNERNYAAEQELQRLYPLKKAIVVNTQYASHMENLVQIGKVGANYLTRLMEDDAIIGVTWGKTIHSVVNCLPNTIHNTVHAIQLTGDLKLGNPNFDARELVRTIATQMNGSFYYLNCPLYIKSEEIRNYLVKEPVIDDTMKMAQSLDVILTGIGGLSSLPLTNPEVAPYLTEQDRAAVESALGSIYGYVLDADGKIADIDLNKKVITVPLDMILGARHRLVVASGRHKVRVLQKAVRNNLYNELLTDSDTAKRLIECAANE